MFYDEPNPALTATLALPVALPTFNYSLATTATASSNVGSFPIVVTLGSNPNYDVTSTDGSLAITAKTATVTANDKTKVYGEANPALTATVVGAVGSDTLNYSLATN